MPRTDPASFRSLPLRGFRLVDGFPLHDVWSVDLEGEGPCTVPRILDCLTTERARTVPWVVRALFAVRGALGRALRLDDGARAGSMARVPDVPEELVASSDVPPGTPAGPFHTLYRSEHEAVYAAVNATVDARLIVAIRPGQRRHRLYWATYVRPVGRITAAYMALIDPFRRFLVYPGLERWLKRTWREAAGDGTGVS